MFHGCIAQSRKGPAVFYEKDWGKINLAKYDKHILSHIGAFVADESRPTFYVRQCSFTKV
jgi:hypothetical protein